MLNDASQAPSAVFDSLQVPVLLFSCAGDGAITITRLNRAAALCLAVDAELVMGKTTEQVFQGALGIAFQNKLQQVRDQSESLSFNFSIHQEHYSKQLNIDLCSAQIVDETVTSIMATVTDISERQAALSESTKMAHLVNEMESFMAHSAHELQDPIHHLSTLSKELKANFQDLGDGKMQLLDQVEDLCKSTLALINQVLERSRAINASVGTHSRFDFKALCTSTFGLFDPLGHHQLVVDDAWVTGDAHAMRLVIATLFENSIKHNAMRALTVSVSISHSREPGMLSLTVHDNGKGFDNPKEAFMDKGTNNTSPGLCLINLQKMINSTGGDITATATRNGRGAAVLFTIAGELA